MTDGAEPPEGGYGWIIVLSTTMISISVLPLVNNFGLIFEKEFSLLGITAAEKSFLQHLHIAINCSLGLISSPLLKMYSYKRVALLGTSLMSLGILLTSFANSYQFFILTMALYGIGQGILFPATYVATSSYFKKKLTLAICFSVTGTGLANILTPIMCSNLLTTLGRKHTVLILFLISLISIIFCCLLKTLKRNQCNDVALQDIKTTPNENSLLKDENIYKSTTIPINEKKSLFKIVHNLFNLQLLKERSYVITTIGLSTSFVSESNVIILLPFLLTELAGLEISEVAIISSTLSIADVFGRLVLPLAANYLKISPKVMYGVSLTISSIARTVLAFAYQSKLLIFLCATLLGLGKGTKAVYQSVIIPKLVSLDKLPAANGLNMLLTGCLSLLLGPILGSIHDATNSYVYVLHAGSIISMSCVLFWLLDYCFTLYTSNR